MPRCYGAYNHEARPLAGRLLPVALVGAFVFMFLTFHMTLQSWRVNLGCQFTYDAFGDRMSEVPHQNGRCNSNCLSFSASTTIRRQPARRRRRPSYSARQSLPIPESAEANSWYGQWLGSWLAHYVPDRQIRYGALELAEARTHTD
jgi:hypothetical protein